MPLAKRYCLATRPLVPGCVLGTAPTIGSATPGQCWETSPQGCTTGAALAKRAGEGRLSWEPKGRPHASPVPQGVREGVTGQGAATPVPQHVSDAHRLGQPHLPENMRRASEDKGAILPTGCIASV